MLFTFLEMTDYAVKCTFSVVVVSGVCPYILIIACFSLYYLLILRRKNMAVTRDTIRLKYTLTSPINSLI